MINMKNVRKPPTKGPIFGGGDLFTTHFFLGIKIKNAWNHHPIVGKYTELRPSGWPFSIDFIHLLGPNLLRGPKKLPWQNPT